MANPLDDAGNVRVDHVWGNLPLQPNDARGAAVLDYALDNHVIAETGRYAFPSYDPTWIGDGDDVPNAVVPAITNVLESTALSRLTAAGLVGVAGATTTEGATESNNGKVATQSPVSNTKVNQGDTVTYSLFEYVAP